MLMNLNEIDFVHFGLRELNLLDTKLHDNIIDRFITSANSFGDK